MEYHHSLKRSKKGQLTFLDLLLAPLAAVFLSILAAFFLQSSTAHILTAVTQQPTIDACNLALDSLYGTYYVHTLATLTQLELTQPSQYLTAVSGKAQSFSLDCGSSCSESYTFLSSSLSNSSSLFNDFISYFNSFSLSQFDSIKSANSLTLDAIGMEVFMNQVPTSVSNPTAVCSLQVYNPADPSSPKTIFGVMT